MSMRRAPDCCQHPQGHFELVARGAGAFLVIDIVGGLGARRPGKQHRRAGIAGIVDDLGQAVDRVVEAGVVAMDEDHDAAAARRDIGVERAGEFRLRVVADDLGSHEIFRRVIRLAARAPLDLAGLVEPAR